MIYIKILASFIWASPRRSNRGRRRKKAIREKLNHEYKK